MPETLTETRPLRVFANDYDTIAAYDLHDVKRWYVDEQRMIGPDDFDSDDWVELTADEPLTIHQDADDFVKAARPEGMTAETREGRVYATATVAAWVAVSGRGMICSTEY